MEIMILGGTLIAIGIVIIVNQVKIQKKQKEQEKKISRLKI